MKTIEMQFNDLNKIKCFEIPVFDKRTEENTYIVFDISINEGKFIAQHEATTKEEQESNKIAFCSTDIDIDFSLDENLQGLYDECIEKVVSSDFFELQE